MAGERTSSTTCHTSNLLRCSLSFRNFWIFWRWYESCLYDGADIFASSLNLQRWSSILQNLYGTKGMGMGHKRRQPRRGILRFCAECRQRQMFDRFQRLKVTKIGQYLEHSDLPSGPRSQKANHLRYLPDPDLLMHTDTLTFCQPSQKSERTPFQCYITLLAHKISDLKILEIYDGSQEIWALILSRLFQYPMPKAKSSLRNTTLIALQLFTQLYPLTLVRNSRLSKGLIF